MRLDSRGAGPPPLEGQARRLKLWLMRRLVLDVGPLQGGVVLVAGSARSGTTWVAECVAGAIDAHLIFEPFVVDERGRPAVLSRTPWHEPVLRLGCSQYLPRAGADAPWSDAVERILSGSLTHHWNMLPVAPGIYRRRVIKAVRANLLLAHVAERWPRVPILWLQRHPLEVVNSQLRMCHETQWEFDWRADHVLRQPTLMRDWLQPFEPQIRGAESLVERLAVRWSVENYVAHVQTRALPSVVRLSFHALRADAAPWKAIAELLGRLLLGREPKLDGREAPPSFTARRAADEIDDPASLDYLSDSEQDCVMQVVRGFGLEELVDGLKRT